MCSGFGTLAAWHRNLSANPQVTVALPGRVVHGIAVPVRDPVETERAALAVVRNCGVALVFEGMNPPTATDAPGWLAALSCGPPDRSRVRPRRHDRARTGGCSLGGLGCSP